MTPKYPNVKTLISVDNGLMAMGVIEDYETIKNYIVSHQSNPVVKWINGFYEFDMPKAESEDKS